MGVRHEHSEAAYNMLERYNVTTIQKVIDFYKEQSVKTGVILGRSSD